MIYIQYLTGGGGRAYNINNTKFINLDVVCGMRQIVCGMRQINYVKKG